MNNITDLLPGIRPPIHLLVTDETTRAFAVPYNLINQVAGDADEVRLFYSNRELHLVGSGLVSLGRRIAAHSVKDVSVGRPDPGKPESESQVTSMAPAGGPGDKVKVKCFDVVGDFEPVEEGSPLVASLLLTLGEETVIGVSYHFVSHMEYSLSKEKGACIAFEFPGRRFELYGINLGGLWKALTEHRVVSIDVKKAKAPAAGPGTSGIGRPFQAPAPRSPIPVPVF